MQYHGHGPQGSEIWGFDTSGTNAKAFWNDITENFLDEYGFFDYDLIVKPYVIKQITYPVYVEEVIYTYDSFSLIYNVNEPGYISPEASPDNSEPFKDIGILIGPDGEIIGRYDNSDDYDFDEDGNIIDKDGNIVAIPIIEDGYIRWYTPDGELILETPFGDKRPSPEDITNGTIKDKNYDITGIIQGLKTDLQSLVNSDGSLSKMFSFFRQIFEWLPFGMLKIFGIIISFFIIFKFINIISR